MRIVNGKLPTSMLTPIYRNPGYLIRTGPAASGLMRLSQRSHAKGYGFITVNSAYRAYNTQDTLFRDHYVPFSQLNGRKWFDSWWWNGQLWCRVSGNARIAPPGDSNHGEGLAVDLAEPYMTTGPKHAWFVDRLDFYGFWWEGKGFDEPWHYTSRNKFPKRPALHEGSKGDAVVAWQIVLRYDLRLTAKQMKADGIAGPIFDHWTKVWQKRKGLKADGIVGPKSWAKAGLA
jgi:peptidoglycan hydrolase-like protein with peptidoglycan-binding domain